MLTRTILSPSWALLDAVDRLSPRVQTAFNGNGDGAAVGGGSVPVNIAQDSEHFYIEAVVPGLRADQLEVTWQEQALTIRGAVSVPSHGDAKVIWHEVKPYKFQRSIRLATPIDPDRVEAKLQDGILSIVAPKADHARARTIKVTGVEKPAEQLA